LLGADLAFVANRSSDAPSLLLKAAKRLEPIDADLARATYLQALCSAMFAGRLSLGGGVLEVARDVEAAPPPTSAPRAPDFLLDGLVAHYNTGYAAGLAMLRRALDVFGWGMSVEEQLRWYWVVDIVAGHVWDDDRWHVLTHRHVQLARDVGALSELPMALNARAFILLFAGDLVEVAALVQELQAVTEATGIKLAPYAGMALAAMRGGQEETAALVDATMRDVRLRGEGNGIAVAEWATAVLNNGVGNYETAMTSAQRASEDPGEMLSPTWAAVELIEAAARSGNSDVAVEALRRLAEITSASGTDWALGVEARSRALLSDGDTADRFYLESIERLGRTRMRGELARAHLLYGEWLRRQRRRVDARAQLRIAHDMLDSMGMDGFAERARRELKATGEAARKRTLTMGHEQLTAQEGLVARMARDGLSNPEIAARMFISARTVQYHLRKVFAKLGIESRTQIDRVLPD
jgi:DNA-binding CsgD family transcriptional regulator